MSATFCQLCKKLGYTFSDLNLLVMALTHRSAGKSNNERLEFLGDAVLSCVIADELFHLHSDVDEGVLSRLRSGLVKGVTLAEIAKTLQIGDQLILGPGEMKSGGFRRESILAGAFEAVIGAIYLDGGFIEAKQAILNVFDSRLNALEETSAIKDPKTRLQEYLQSRKLSLPIYSICIVTGRDHEQYFTVTCSIEDISEQVIGKGNSRRVAEQDAAEKMLAVISEKSAEPSVLHDGSNGI